VSARATDSKGLQSVRARVVDVTPGSPEYVLPRPFTPPFLSPFPMVRFAGTLSETGVRVSALTVRAPVCSRVTVRCRGEGCPRRVIRLMGRKALRIRAYDRKRLRAGVTLELLVSKRDRIGKYTRFRIRRGRAPQRFDTCLRFGASRGTRCPAG
jgi:hypothetical protein